MHDAVLLAAALGASVIGLAWLALAMAAHWQQVIGLASCSRGTQVRLRTLGAMALLGSLYLCLAVDHGSMAALVWVMMLAAAALIVAFTLTWRARWLLLFVPWARAAASSQ